MIIAFILALLSGTADASSRHVYKLTTLNKAVIVAAESLFALPFFGIWLYLVGLPKIAPVFWVVMLAEVALDLLAYLLTVEAHRSSPLMLTTPYLTLTPALILVVSPLMKIGSPTIWGIIGVLLIVGCLYLLSAEEGKITLTSPLKQLKTQRGSRLMLAVAILFAISGNLDYLGIIYSSVPFFLLTSQGLICLSSLLIFLFSAKAGQAKGIFSAKSVWGIFILCGLLQAVTIIPQMVALKLITNVAYVIALKRVGVIFFSVGSGLFLSMFGKFRQQYEDEKKNLGLRVPAVLLMCVGVVLITLFGKKV